MTDAPEGRRAEAARMAGIELLDRALAYTRGALVEVTDGDLACPTPCRGWSLARLLAHMDDALDAFAEGAAGAVDLSPSVPAAVRVESLVVKACGLLGAWSAVADAGPHASVDVGGVPLDVAFVTHVAALEITLHGWDVARATGRGAPLPDALAERLLPVAAFAVRDGDRAGRFAAALPAAPSDPPSARLLAHVGRTPDWTTSAAWPKHARNRGPAS